MLTVVILRVSGKQTLAEGVEMTGEEIWSQSLRAPVRRTGTDVEWALRAERSIVRGNVK